MPRSRNINTKKAFRLLNKVRISPQDYANLVKLADAERKDLVKLRKLAIQAKGTGKTILREAARGQRMELREDLELLRRHKVRKK